MKTVAYKPIRLDKINVGKRKRDGAPAVDRMAKSLKRFKGPIHPIVVFQDGDFYKLIAGYRRYRASQLNGESKIEARIVKLTDEDEAEDAEVAENDEREEFTVSERVQIKKEIEERIGKRAKGKEVPADVLADFPGTRGQGPDGGRCG